jgi:hypothetical protein
MPSKKPAFSEAAQQKGMSKASRIVPASFSSLLIFWAQPFKPVTARHCQRYVEAASPVLPSSAGHCGAPRNATRVLPEWQSRAF